MHRIDHSTRAVNLFGPGKDGFTEGDPLTETAPTTVTADFVNAVQEELATAIEQHAPLDPLARQQLVQLLSYAFGMMGATSMVARTVDLHLLTPSAGDLLHAASDFEATIVAITNVGGTAARVWSGITAGDLAGRSLDGSPTSILSRVAWFDAAGLFVVVGDNGEIQTSPDGVVWTKRTPAGGYGGYFRALAESPTLLVIGGDNGEIQTSPDGISWTKRTIATTDPIWHLAWSPAAQRFAAVTSAGGIVPGLGDAYASADGITWIAGETGLDAPQSDLGAGPAGFVLLTGTDALFSPDGETWTASALSFTPSRVGPHGVITGTKSYSVYDAFEDTYSTASYPCCALSPARPPRSFARSTGSIWIFRSIRTHLGWVGQGDDNKLYLSPVLPY